jgi:cyclic pyranopterin phosphate synthase
MSEPSSGGLTHLDREGSTRMVDVSDRASTDREASATGEVRISQAAWEAVSSAAISKGNVLEVAKLAGIMGAKRTPDLIPLCHPLTLTHIAVDARLASNPPRVQLQATVRCHGNTGVEMEALTAVSVAALTVIDMIKSVDPWAQAGSIGLLAKGGGRSGDVRRPGPVDPEAPGQG